MVLGLTIAILGGALAAILGGIGSAIGVGLAGQASSGVMSEDPEKFGSLLLLVALPGTQGIYGFLSAFLVILKLGLTTTTVATLSSAQGWQILIACLPVAFAGLVSGIHQGKVCASGVYMVAKQRLTIDELFNKATDDNGPFGDHLRHHSFRLHGQPELIQGLRQVIHQNTCPDERVFFRLRGAGLVRRPAGGGAVLPRCQLYANYFRERLDG